MMIRALLIVLAATPLAAQNVPRKQIVEDLRLDAAAEDFPQISRMAIGPRGQIAIFVAQDQSVRLYDSAGTKIGSFGRRGAGPGESRTVNALGFKADTFWYYDLATKRLAYVTPAAKLLRHEVLPVSLNRGAALDTAGGNHVGAMYSFNPVMIVPGGKVVAYANEVVGRDEQGKIKTEMSFLVANVDGTDGKKIGTFAKSPAPTQVTVRIDEKRTATAGVPFLTYPGMVYSTDGTRYGALTTAFTDRGGTYRVFVVKTNGDTLFARTYPFVGTPIPAAIRDSAIDAIPSRRTSPTGGLVYEPKIGAKLRDLIEPMTPRVYRPVQDMIIGRDNTTWLKMRPIGKSQELIALNAKGDPIMSVSIPSNSELKEASLTALWVIELDADDLPSLVRYRIK